MKVSVVIPTFRRWSDLADTLSSLRGLDPAPLEVIVVDQQPDPLSTGESRLASERNLWSEKTLRWISVDFANLPRARNLGIGLARGDIVLFLDDDVRVDAGLIAEHRQAHEIATTGRPIGCVAGRVEDEAKRRHHHQDANGGDALDLLPAEAMDPAIGWYHLDVVRTTRSQPILSARGCNMSFKRALFEEHDLWFDERFDGQAVREESDVCLRLHAKGQMTWFAAEAWLHHLAAREGGCRVAANRRFRAAIAFYHHHFLLARKNLTPADQRRFRRALFSCHVRGEPPCHKDPTLWKVAARAVAFQIGRLASLRSFRSRPASPNRETDLRRARAHEG